MSITLQSFAASDRNYVQKLNSNFTAIAAAINSLQAAISGGVGPGSQLITDLFDRPGVIGTHSYQLDLDAYAGAALIDIGYRPAPNIAYGETGTSAAWVNTGESFERVQLAVDATLSFAAIITALPKTVYVVLPGNGTPQVTESDVLPNVLYLYSMTWDGYQIDIATIKRMYHLLPGYELIKDMARRPQMLSIFDPETDWVSDEQGMTSILIPGAIDEENFAEMAYEVLGFFVNAARGDEDGFSAPAEAIVADDTHVKFKITSEGEDWTDEDASFDFDCSNMPDFQFIPISDAIGDDRYVVESRTFEMERTFLGPAVVSARAFQWGVLVRPIYGPAFAKDTDFVDQI